MASYESQRNEPVHVDPAHTQNDRADRPLSSLLSELATETTTLVRKEVELARAEMSEKVNQAMSGAVALMAGGFVAFAGLIFLLLSATLGLANWMSDWLAALIVGGVVAIIGGIMVMSGKNRLSAQNLQPRRTIETLQEDKQWAQSQMKR
ncbi:MAG TPA: phage holin family protein [Arenibaculum sp.]|nr:phage holin family protein [Arenibaculum sp.]